MNDIQCNELVLALGAVSGGVFRFVTLGVVFIKRMYWLEPWPWITTLFTLDSECICLW